MKTRISAPAHPSATGGRVSGLVKSILKAITLISNYLKLSAMAIIMIGSEDSTLLYTLIHFGMLKRIH